jgi:hypothetical protein
MFNRKQPSSQQPGGLTRSCKMIIGASAISAFGTWCQVAALPLAMLPIVHNYAQWVSTYYMVLAVAGIFSSFLGGDCGQILAAVADECISNAHHS